MGKKLGLEGKLYYDPLGVGKSSWTELDNCKDVNLSMEAGEADVTTRGNNGWRATIATLLDAGIEFEMVYDTADEGFTALQTAFLAKSTIGIAVMDGDITQAGSQGLQADCVITSFGRNEPLEEGMSVPVTIKPTYSSTAPEWKKIEAS